MKKVMKKSGLATGILILITVCAGIVFADDVVVQEGDVDVKNLDASGDVTVTGKVGIGTSSPSYKLDVDGDMSVTGDVIAGGFQTPTQYCEFQSTYSGTRNCEMYFLGPKDDSMWYGFFADGEDGWWGPAFGIYLEPSTPQGDGQVVIGALYGDGVLRFENHDLDIQSTKKLMFNDEKLTINHDGTNARMDYGETTSDVLRMSGKVSALGYDTRTTVYDKSKGKALDWVKDSSAYVGAGGEIKHSEFYGHVSYSVTDYGRAEEEYYDEIVRGPSGARKAVRKSRTVYPHQKTEEGVSMGDEIAVLRQAVYELKEENEMLREELCSRYPGYSWCE